jgi:uncharacterized membrane protein SirB2
MAAFACVVIVLCGISFMIITGVGPFSNEPWLKYHLAYKKKDKSIQALLLYPSILFFIICSLILIGVVG